MKSPLVDMAAAEANRRRIQRLRADEFGGKVDRCATAKARSRDAHGGVCTIRVSPDFAALLTPGSPADGSDKCS